MGTNKKLLVLLTLLLSCFVVVSLVCFPVPAKADDDIVLAVGNGFKVTQEDAVRLEQYFAERNFFSTKEEHLNVALKLRLFEQELMREGIELGGGNDGQQETGVSDRLQEEEAKNPDYPEVERLLKYRDAYITKLLNEYVIDDLVVESYYYSRPELFSVEKESGEVETLPLNEDLRKKIKEKVLTLKIPAVEKKAFEALKDKYDIKLCGSEDCR